MANRATYEGPRCFYAKMVNVFARVTFGATGAPTLDAANSRGVLSVTRNSAGVFTFVFGSKVNKANALDAYVGLADADATFDTSGVGTNALAAAPQVQILASNVSSGTLASLEVGLSNTAATPALTDPANGEVGHFRFSFIDTKAG